MLSCGKTLHIMAIISNKKSVNKGVKAMAAKAMSWSQVCKQISGIGGYIEIGDGEKVRPLQLMQSLGVHVQKNSYSPKDIFTAWSARLTFNGKVQIMKSKPIMVVIGGVEYALHTKSESAYLPLRKQVLCNLVSATDRVKGSDDAVVTAQNVLRGLQQSVFINDTLDKLAKSEAKCEALTTGWVNMAVKKTDVPMWAEVVKDEKGNWDIKVAKVEKQSKSKGGKKGGRKAA